MMNYKNAVKRILLSLICLLSVTTAMGANPIQTIQSSILKVTIDPTFPRVLGYTWRENGAILYGQEDVLSEIKINGEAHEPAITFHKSGSTRANYKMHFPKIETTMIVSMAVVENVLDFKITKIEEKGAFKVKSIEFPNHSLVSVRSTQSKPAVATALITGIWNQITEKFNPLSEMEFDAEPTKQTYLIINSDELAASIDNNVIYYERTRSQTTKTENYKKSAIWNGVWTYREIESEIIGLPWSKVIIVADKNDDGVVDWQDGAIGFRENMEEPLGANDIRNSISYISFNAGSVANAPFLRALEDAKQLNLMLDGFGQMIQLKGYQSEGHDAAHPDCAGNYNNRAGGLKDLQTFMKYSPKYNIKLGVHINVSESYPEAKNFSDIILRVPHEGGWYWYDSALKIDYRKDILSGSLYSRLDQMKEELPELAWVYVDVYGNQYGNDFWAAYKLGTKLNDNGWLVASEYFGPMERQLLWAHHLYAVPEIKMVRFIKNHVADIFRREPLLKGANAYGVGGWENNFNFNNVVRTFYSDNLPTKYMQHFPIIKMTDDRVDFEGNVYVDNSDGWKLYKDGNMISDGKNMFIPWDPITEEKVYHWNSSGGPSTWNIPSSWSKKSQLKLYKLTPHGREFVSDLNVSQLGEVTIEGQANTPYVVYKKEQPSQKTVWGEGSLVKDHGFSSHGFSAWSKTSTASNTDHITIEIDGNANAMLSINTAKKCGDNATISQEITGLTPGKTYSASVWVNVTGGRKAWIEVEIPGGNNVKNWVDRTNFRRSEHRLKFRGTTFQRLPVLFDMPANQTSATLLLKVEAGDAASTAQFDDIRIAEMAGRTPQGNHIIEDFENVDEQWGPFVAANGTDFTHLSETNPGYTTDTINGQFSLKNVVQGGKGEILRTVQSTLKLSPNTSYQIGFNYIHDKANYRVAVKTTDGGDDATVLDEVIPDGNGAFSTTFKTGNYSDYYIAFETETSHLKLFVIDDFILSYLEP